MKRTAKSGKGVRGDGSVVEGATIMSGAREGERDKNGVRGRGGDSGGREKKEEEVEAEAG